MSETKTYPTDAAWAYFMAHRDDIRSICEQFLPVPKMQIPNTRVVLDEVETNERASVALPVSNTIADFDTAVKTKDSDRLCEIMNSAWLRAPESTSVYRILGFTRCATCWTAPWKGSSIPARTTRSRVKKNRRSCLTT